MSKHDDNLAAVHDDDALLDALGRGVVPQDPDPVEALLVGWRREALEEPFRGSVTVEDALAAFRVPRRPNRVVRWWRWVRRSTTPEY